MSRDQLSGFTHGGEGSVNFKISVQIVKMKVKTKKVLTKIALATFFFLSGTEYAVIIPTMYMYSHERYGAESWFYACIFAGFSFSSLITNPLFGILVDYTRKTKGVILFANLFEIAGNFLYFIAWNKYWILIGRLVAGIGAGAGTAIFAQIAWTTTEQERTGVYSIAMGCRQLGLLIGPSFNLFLKETNFDVGPFKVDHYTSPGIFMAVCWIIQEIIILFMYYELPSIKEEEQKSVNDEHKPLLSNGGITNGSVSGDSSDQYYNPRRRSSSRLSENLELAKGLLSEAVVVIVSSHFILLFNETSFEALYTPLTNYYLGWKEVEISISFILIASEAICVFVLVRKLSTRLADRWLIAIGVTFESLALVWYLFMLANSKPHESKIIPVITVGTLLIVFGLPFFVVSNVSLLSKVTHERNQGLAQGILRSAAGVASILGPLWGGSLGTRLYLTLGVMAGLEAFLAVLILLSFRRLRPLSDTRPKTLYTEISTNEPITS